MGVVYEALDVALGRQVAIKTLIPAPHADPEEERTEQERFLREAQLAARAGRRTNATTWIPIPSIRPDS